MSVLDAEPCPRHPGRTAAFACAACGRPICIDCGGEFDGKRHCEVCLAAAYRRAVGTGSALGPRGVSGIRLGLAVLAVFGLLAGAAYLALRPSIERAKAAARDRSCALALARVHDAARLYAEDHGRRLPSAPDGRSETLVSMLVETGYLYRRPAHLAPGTVVPDERTLDGDPLAPYLVDDLPHGDGKRHLLRADGHVESFTEAEVAAELAKKTWSAPAASTAPTMTAPTATATAATATATAATATARTPAVPSPTAAPPLIPSPTIVPPGGP